MKTNNFSLLVLMLVGLQSAFAQAPIDAYRYSQSNISGTARYRSMGGAFGALGGDISALGNNPAGIGIFRNNEVSGTLNLSIVDTHSATYSNNRTPFNFSNVGYVGTFYTGNSEGLISYNAGFSYNRNRNFSRQFRVGNNNLKSSLSNYIAALATQGGVDPKSLTYVKDQYDPYVDSNNSWLNILGYESYLFNPESAGSNKYVGVFNPANDKVNSYMNMREEGYIDEFNFSAGGNVNDKLYWGVTLGVTNLSYRLSSDYQENAQYAQPQNGLPPYKDGEFALKNYLATTGTGINFNLGIIARPTQFLRLGLAVNSPIFFALTDVYDASLNYNNMLAFNSVENKEEQFSGRSTTPTDYGLNIWDYSIRTPWRFSGSAAFVIGKYGLISAEYEYMNYASMYMSDSGGANTTNNALIDEDYRGGHTVKVGAEARLTSQLSLRAGYAIQLTPIKSHVIDGLVETVTAGTTPQFALNKGIQYYSAGLGYKFGNAYIDFAYIFKAQLEDFYNFSPLFAAGEQVVFPEKNKITTNTHSMLLTLGYKF